MALVIAALVLRSIYGAFQARERVADAAEASSIARGLAEVVVLGGKERGLAALVASGRDHRPLVDALAAARAQLDDSATAMLERARQRAARRADTVLAAVIETAEARRREALAARALVDGSAQAAERDDATDRWIDAMTHLNEALIELHGELLDTSEQSESLREAARLNHLLLDAAEHGGQERAIISAALAEQVQLTGARLEDLQERRGVVEHSLENLDAFLLPRAPPEGVRAEIASMKRTFLDELVGVRAQAYRCVTLAEPCALTPEDWFARVTAGIDAVVALERVTAARAADELERAERSALRSLVTTAVAGSFAFSLILFAGGFVRRRIAARLEVLRDGALKVAEGELERPVQVPGADEISDLAGAVEHMRATLAQQNRELRALLEQLKEAQVQLVQQERMASVGQLAGGVAHELNNPLAVVLGNVAHLIDSIENPGPAGPLDAGELHETLLEVREATERATAIVRDLRDFATGGPGARGRVADLDLALGELTAPLRGAFSGPLRLDLDLQAPVAVAGSRAALAQVVPRLLDNAREACGARGTVTVRTRSDEEHARIVVEDTGPGIPPELLGRVLEPFFTTKRIGAGTGLGLSVCVGIVHQLGGTLSVDSAPGQGTRVTVELPRST